MATCRGHCRSLSRPDVLECATQLQQLQQLFPRCFNGFFIIPQLAVYTTYIPLIYCLLGGDVIPTTFYGNQKQPLIVCSARWRSILRPLEEGFQEMRGLSPAWRKIGRMKWTSGIRARKDRTLQVSLAM